MMSFLMVRGLDAEGLQEVWKLKAVDFFYRSRVLYVAKTVAGFLKCWNGFLKIITLVKALQRTLEYGANESA
jgi:hypothetical protein